MKLYVVGRAYHVSNWIDNCIIVDSPEDADTLLFTGGADISPSLYGEKKGLYTQINYNRDIKEQEIFNKNLNKPKIGICRGSQFLTVMNGGKLFQHVSNHTISGLHSIITDGGNFEITSTHHQMMNPFNLPDEDYEMIGYSKIRRSDTYLNGDNEECKLPPVEPEIVLYPKTKSLCIQGHPEYMEKCKLHNYLNIKIKTLCHI
jgi:GMP synthase-like glutamine amidotransferase